MVLVLEVLVLEYRFGGTRTVLVLGGSVLALVLEGSVLVLVLVLVLGGSVLVSYSYSRKSVLAQPCGVGVGENRVTPDP